MRLTRICVLAAVLLFEPSIDRCPAGAQLIGHGGPVRALAVSEDGATAFSGSFDASAIRWSLDRGIAEEVMRLHDNAVNAVAILRDVRAVTGGADARIAIWTHGRRGPDTILEGHTGPIAALAVSPDGTTLVSASWDRTVRLWPLAGGAPTVFEGHQQHVNAVAFAPDGKSLVSAGYDATVRLWPLSGPSAPAVMNLGAPLNAVIVAPDGEIAAGGSDGHVHFLSPDGHARSGLAISAAPITSLAMARDGDRIAAASTDGSLAFIDRRSRSILRTRGTGAPIWAVAFLPDTRTLLSGGGDHAIHRWDAETLEPQDTAVSRTAQNPLAAYAGDPGATVFRACAACHALQPDDSSRAGPNLHGLFGRRIATLSGYNFSPALRQLDFVWTRETVAKLFEIGPAAYTPARKCRSSASAGRKTARPSSISSNARQSDQGLGFSPRSRR
jgi:cytochrome c